MAQFFVNFHALIFSNSINIRLTQYALLQRATAHRLAALDVGVQHHNCLTGPADGANNIYRDSRSFCDLLPSFELGESGHEAATLTNTLPVRPPVRPPVKI